LQPPISVYVPSLALTSQITWLENIESFSGWVIAMQVNVLVTFLLLLVVSLLPFHIKPTKGVPSGRVVPTVVAGSLADAQVNEAAFAPVETQASDNAAKTNTVFFMISLHFT
jgi:hypothetical protein